MIDLVTAYVAMYRENAPDRIAALIAEDFIDHGLPQLSGRAGVAAAIASLHARFSDVVVAIDHVVASGDRVAFVVTIDATRNADRQRMHWQIADFARVANGRFAELWSIHTGP